MFDIPHIVIDTNVLVAALRSQYGWSHVLFRKIGSGEFDICLSVSLVLEYEEVIRRLQNQIGLSPVEIDTLLEYFCKVGRCLHIDYSWRPAMIDPGDDMVFELAVAAQADFIVTFNGRHFRGSERFGRKVCTPQEFMIHLSRKP